MVMGMKSRISRRVCGFIVLAALQASGNLASADSITFVASGLNPADTGSPQATVKADATFTVTQTSAGHFDLTMVLTNDTQAQTGGATLARSDVLVGVVFNISSNPTVADNQSVNPTLTSGSQLFLHQGDYAPTPPTNPQNPVTGSTANSDLADTWTNVMTSHTLGSYGVGTSGYGNVFSMGSATGGAPGQQNSGTEDYGLVNSNYPLAGNSFKSAFPLVLNSLTFDFTVAGVNSLSASQISGVKFLFGTAGTGTINGHTQNPEPSSMVLAGIGVVGLAAWRRRRASRVAA